MSPPLQIGEAARRSGVSAKMVRHYESLGLLPSVHRTESGYRQYTDSEVHTLQFIKRARELGFSMAEIAELVNLCDRVMVLYGGRVAVELAGDAIEEETIMRAALGDAARRTGLAA